VANIVMDVDGVETVDFNALGGADTVTVNDLSGTAVTQVNTNLAAGGGGGDLRQDQVVVNGTADDDTITVAGDASAVSVTGLAAAVAITGHDPTDRLDVNTLAGNDTVATGGLTPGVIQLFVDGVQV